MQAKTDKEQLTNEARAEGKLACTMPCKENEDESQIEALYRVMYKAMMAKDTLILNHIHADDFVLTHMTEQQLFSEADVTSGGCSFISTFPRKKAGGILHLHVLRHIEKDNDNSSICSFFVFR